MAWNIIRQESKKSGKRSRLGTFEDICPMLENNTGTESVKGMLLDMSKINRRVFISPTAFARMRELKFLKFYYSGFSYSSLRRERKAFLEKGLESFPGVLSYLHWDEYPSKSLPSNFCPESLVEMRMPNSDVKRLWDGVQNLGKLKFLDLSDSQYLIKVSDLSKATNLETIFLGGCSNLTKFPKIPKNLMRLTLSGTAIEEVPSSIGHVSRLRELYLINCRRLERLPSSICKLKFLELLYLNGCLKLESFPELSETMKSFKILDLSHTSIEDLHSSIENLVALCWLELDNCAKLKNLPNSIRELKSLDTLSLINCTKLSSLPGISSTLNSFGELTVSGFSKLEVIKELLGTVEVLNIHPSYEATYESGTLSLDCSLFAFPKHLMDMSSLTKLNLSRNDFKTIPVCIKKLLRLHMLDLRYCERLQFLPPELPPNLQYLYALGCKSLEKVSSAFPISLHKEQRFLFTNCVKLDQNCISWVKTPLNIQEKAAKDVNLYHVKYHHYVTEPIPKSSLTILFPGSGSESEIPEWFSCKSQGSSVTIRLPPHLHVNNKFVGFTVCAVLAFSHNFFTFSEPFPAFRWSTDDFHVSCRYKFNTNGDDVLDFPRLDSFRFNDFTPSECPISFDLDNVLIGYNLDFYHIWYNEKNKHHLTEASFEFSVRISIHDLSNYCVVKECGVCLLYVQDDLMVFPHRSGEGSIPLMIQPSSSHDPTWPSLKCGVINQDFGESMIQDGLIINHESGSCRSSDLFAQSSSSYDTTGLPLIYDFISQDFGDPWVKDGTAINRLRDEYCCDEAEPSGNFSCNEEEEPQRKRLKYMYSF